ncbi:MAG: acyl-CoA synthetase [Gemmatimonadales bacterium]
MEAADLLCNRAARHGERLALIDATGPTSYAELERRSAQAASMLLAGTVDLAEARIAYLIAPGAEHAAIQWAIWRAGGIAVPLALSHPERELAYVLEDAGASLLVADDAHWERARAVSGATGTLRVRAGSLLVPREPAPLPRLGPDRRALMIYTSGTTGRPKGVVTTHGNLRAQVTTLVDAWGWTPEDRILHVLPLHHVHGLVNVLSCALWTGAACELLPKFEPVAVWERLGSGEVSLFMAVPTIFARLISAWESADPDSRSRWSAGARGLRLMVSGSAALPVAVLERWRAITGHTLLERYGMTEIGMALSNPLEGERRPGTVGQPFAGVALRLVDESGSQLGSDEPGEIEVRGPQVFREYWARPAETEAAFRDGWFRTGDLAVLERGYYRMLGRKSTDLIKSAGYKVSALEIEELLREHPDVADCAVVALPDPDLGERIAAAVVARDGATLDPARLGLWAKDRLAPYKVPREIRLVAELPRNAMGKVTKPVLREQLGVSASPKPGARRPAP